MQLTELQPADSIFIDANIFIYHFSGQSAECRTLFERCARRELVGYTSTPVLAEVLHRLMVAEAIQQGLVTAKNAVQKLTEKPALVKQLHQYNENVSQIGQMNLVVASLTPAVLAASAELRKTEGLLTNDSLVVASMLDLGLTKLASADEGFERIARIQVYKPSDL
jgi:predicted nucleic acid-binding protein